mmetsp:Transcript_5598/g.11667  ORF Transcript_5598/g.11667 Transcript_5598/m.11667 type:complete len:238 (+) Transcript_5598:661-1374(+)
MAKGTSGASSSSSWDASSSSSSSSSVSSSSGVVASVVSTGGTCAPRLCECGRDSKLLKSLESPPSTPATEPSQFFTTHFPVSGSNFGLGFGASRASRSSSPFWAFCFEKAATFTKPVSICCISPLWSVRISFRRLRRTRARYTSMSFRGKPSLSVSGVSTPMGLPPPSGAAMSSSTIAEASDSSALRFASRDLSPSRAAFWASPAEASRVGETGMEGVRRQVPNQDRPLDSRRAIPK